MSNPLRIANCSGFYGDRLSAAAEMVRGGPIDVLTGDYLAELTLAILYRVRARKPALGYASSFLTQMEAVLGECLDKKIKVVANAGGLNPAGLAAELEAVAGRLGLRPKIAYVDGDDLMPRLAELAAAGEPLAHLEHGAPLASGRGEPVTANVYLGGWGIARALAEGADVVITPRVTDAALVVGPAAWRFGWRADEWDKLAGAVAAGHIIECGPQACGGNYAFFEEVADWRNLGFPIAEIAADGSCVITKHPGTGGVVNVGTVTAQLLYEIRSPRYYNPDVTARFDALRVTQAGPDRVRVFGARGEPPPAVSKVAVNRFEGYRNAMTILVAGARVEEKARILEAQLREAFAPLAPADLAFSLERSDAFDPARNEDAVARLHVAVADADEAKVGRAFSSRIVELALSTVPGFKLASPPGEAAPLLTYWPALIANRFVKQRVHVAGRTFEIAPPPSLAGAPDPSAAEATGDGPGVPMVASLQTVEFGRLFGARSGDKGGSANLGVWARTAAAYRVLDAFLTTSRLVELLPDLAPYRIERHPLPNLNALNFYVEGLLGQGASSSQRFDPQAKTLAEYLRMKRVRLPAALVEAALAD